MNGARLERRQGRGGPRAPAPRRARLVLRRRLRRRRAGGRPADPRDRRSARAGRRRHPGPLRRRRHRHVEPRWRSRARSSPPFPDAIRYAVFLTDGKNESEPQRIRRRRARRATSGSSSATAGASAPTGRSARCRRSRARSSVARRSSPRPPASSPPSRARWCARGPRRSRTCACGCGRRSGAELAFLKMVNPTLDDLTDRADILGAQQREVFTGAWAAGRDARLPPGRRRRRQVGARARRRDAGGAPEHGLLRLGGRRPGTSTRSARPRGASSRRGPPTSSLSSRIDRQVAHYTGQGELAAAIQTGLELRERGDVAMATQHLGQARCSWLTARARRTRRSGCRRWSRSSTPPPGPCGLKNQVPKAAAMELELESTTTKRSRRRDGPGQRLPRRARRRARRITARCAARRWSR